MVKKTTDPLSDLLGADTQAKKDDKPISAETLLDAVLGDRKITSTRKSKLLLELDALLDRVEVEDGPEEYTDVLIELAPCQGLGLMHNGTMYLHGGRYTVTRGVAADLGEMARRGLSHEAAITKQESAGRRRRNLDANTPVAIRNPATGGMQYF
jgi:hypothetical protein